MESYRLPDGTEVKLKEVKFEALAPEPWAEYRLEDGTFVRIQNVVVRAFRVLSEDGKPAFTPDGEPQVVLRSVRHLVAKER